MTVLETERLRLRRLTVDDAAFILELVNDPSWLRFIGDRGVRNLDDARSYILKGPVASYEKHGFGLWLVELKAEATPIGICGLLQRDTLPDVDIGFALLPQFCGQGYAVRGRARHHGLRPHHRRTEAHRGDNLAGQRKLHQDPRETGPAV